VLRRLGGDGAFLKELLCLCQREMSRRIASVEEALLRMDPARLEREAHSLKAAAMDMETAAGQEDLEGAAVLLGRIKSAFALLSQCLGES